MKENLTTFQPHSEKSFCLPLEKFTIALKVRVPLWNEKQKLLNFIEK